MLVALKRHAEEALATDGVACTRLGYEVLVKIKTDELLEREYLSAPTRDDRHALDATAAIGRHTPDGRAHRQRR
jgi:hypothetical protein